MRSRRREPEKKDHKLATGQFYAVAGTILKLPKARLKKKKMLKVHKWVHVNQRLWDKLIAPIKGEILAPEVL